MRVVMGMCEELGWGVGEKCKVVHSREIIR